MTIAAAFDCIDGIVLGADAKHVTGASQFYQSKIYEVNSDNSQLLVALAGHIDYGKMVVDILEENIQVCNSYTDLRILVEQATRRVYKERIASVFQANDRNRPQIEAIIVASFCKAEPKVNQVAWKIVDASINRIRGFDCVGSGGDIARFCIKWLFPGFWQINIPRHIAEPLLSQAIDQATAFDPEVGGGFEIRAISKPGAEYVGFPSQASSPVASEFKRFATSIREVIIGCLDVRVGDTELKSKLDYFAAQAMALKNADIELNRQLQQQRSESIKTPSPTPSISRKSKRGR